MKALFTATGQEGPFTTIVEATDCWMCDVTTAGTGSIYPKGVIGKAHIGEYVPPPPTTEQRRAAIQARIEALEATITPRRLREAITSDAGKAWLMDLDKQIAALRAELVK